MILIKDIEVYSPKCIGKKDILVSFDKIAYISDNIAIPDKDFPEVKVINGDGLIAAPGIIDLHVHAAGGGGEGGFKTRTPELTLTNLTLSGVTTCVGLLGTDGSTRSMGNLIAKLRALEEEGITTYSWTGCYEVPTRTITDSARSDIIFMDKIIGVGEIAVSDHRGSNPSCDDLIHLASECRVGGMLSGKCGILHMHLGDGKRGLEPIFDVIKNSDVPYENLLPTHINRNNLVYKQSIEYAKAGGYVDITTGIKPEGDTAVYAAEVYETLLKEKISPYHITMSSDAGGSMPIFDENNRLVSLKTELPSTDMETIRMCISHGISMEEALIPLTSSPAKLLKLKGKGNIKENYDADILLLDKNLSIHTVISKGKIMVDNYKAVIRGSFEN
ncbi:beta-aspartyl-peptidase [Clostridium sp. JN-1]|uniref:beta-aspartyl-peptidase n=1 Tax=Clostridium sp. JN-1 TaxID=2483110 RepID=UPI000F0B945C|nr:beta-aspartyl-peptidase [Clostridium sp. JN-1]